MSKCSEVDLNYKHTHAQGEVFVKYLWRTYPTEPLGPFKNENVCLIDGHKNSFISKPNIDTDGSDYVTVGHK